jgi:hypothetical protein
MDVCLIFIENFFPNFIFENLWTLKRKTQNFKNINIFILFCKIK